MALITLYHTFVDGYIEDGRITAIRLNTNFNTAYSLLNGNLEDDNVKNPSKILITNRNYTATGYEVSGNWKFTGDFNLTGTLNGKWTLPAADGAGGQVLQTDGHGVLSWVTGGGGGGVTDHGALTGLADDDHTQYSKLSFSSIIISGQTTVVPTTRADSLTLVAGANVTLTTAAKQVTIAAGAGAIPAGVIVMWSGLLVNIPSGWVLCNGSNGTPDLRSKFVKGSAVGIDPGVTGGAATHVHADHDYLYHSGTAVGAHSTLSHSGSAVGDHTGLTHTVTQPTAHTHEIIYEGAGAQHELVTSYTHSGTAVAAHGSAGTVSHSVTQPNDHTISTHSVTQPDPHVISAHAAGSSEPAYYSLAFIMKT